MDWTAVLTPSLGATGLLAAVVILVLTGRLVPRSVMEDLRTDKDAQIETWKTAYERAMAGQDTQRQHITTLLDANRTATHVIQALPQAVHLDERSSRAALEEG